MRRGRRCAGVIAGVAALCLCVPAGAAAETLAKSTFKSDTENWKVEAGAGGDREDPDHVATGGSPGGFVQIVDQTDGVAFWRAPAEFRGNQGGAFKGTLEWAWQQSATDNGFFDVDVILEGGAQQLTLDVPDVPPATPFWGEVAVQLKPAGWEDSTVLPLTPATKRDMKNVLSDVEELKIRAEHRTGEDTDGLDSVFLRSG